MSNEDLARTIVGALDLMDEREHLSDFRLSSLQPQLERFYDYLRGLDREQAVDGIATAALIIELAGELNAYREADTVVREVRRLRSNWYPSVDPLVAYLNAQREGQGDVLAELVNALRGAAAPPLRVELYDVTDHEDYVEHRWRIVHTSNGETMGSGEGYVDRRARDHAVAVLFPGVETVEVDE